MLDVVDTEQIKYYVNKMNHVGTMHKHPKMILKGDYIVLRLSVLVFKL